MSSEEFPLEKLPLGDRVVSVANESRTLIQKEMIPDISRPRWIVKEVSAAAGLARGLYAIDRASEPLRDTQVPYSGAIVHRDKQSVYQVSNGEVFRHDGRNFSSEVQVGSKVDVSYRGGVASVSIAERAQRGPYAQKADDFRAMPEADLKHKYASDLAIASALKAQTGAREFAKNTLWSESSKKQFVEQVHERIAKHLEHGKPINVASMVKTRDDQMEY